VAKGWAVAKSDVVESGGRSNVPAGSGSHPRKGARKPSRKSGTSGVAMKLRHFPTGLEATGQIPSEHFSKTELIAAKEHLRAKLWAELEDQVARELRIPGRTDSHR
jgi:hypothetical protein